MANAETGAGAGVGMVSMQDINEKMTNETQDMNKSNDMDASKQAPATSKPQPRLFIKKKPTVASIGSRPLLKPFNNKFTDYNNPGKDDLIALSRKSIKGTAISIPGPTLTPSTTASSSTSSLSSTIPFTFDNHTSGSRSRKESLVANTNSNEALTILRIKRKRHEEPLDTLVVQEQLEKLAGKKQKKIDDELQQAIENERAGNVSLPKAPPAVFRLATTVNTDSFKDPTQSIQLRDRINSLAETPRPRSRMSDRHLPEFEERVNERRGELAQAKQKEARSARYRVINQNRPGLNTSDQLPPKVKSSVEVEAEAALDMFKMYDAVKEDGSKSKKKLAEDEEKSDIMCNFLPMVREYLTISDRTPEPKISVDESTGERSYQGSETRSDLDSEDEYVYDIYYRDMSADHQQESKHRAIGSLLWFSDDENNFMNEDDSSEDDYEDSDSNAEDYYQNDYPEDELSDNDHGYELSDSDDDEYMY